MDSFVEIARADELPLGCARSVVVEGRTIALYHTTHGFFASEGRCPHRGGPLAEGDIIGNEIVCPWHLWSFDVRDGICAGNPTVAITTHELRVEGGRIFVRLSEVPQASEP